MALERRAIKAPAEFKADVDAMTLKGHASVFDNVDSYGDRVRPGAFVESIDEKFAGQAVSKIKVLYSHVGPMGLPTVLKEDRIGLYFEAKITDTPTNRERMAYIADGVVEGASIGFNTQKAKTFSDDEGEGPDHRRDLLKLDLWELGPCLWGANDGAYAEAASAAEGLFAQLEAGRVLTEAELKQLDSLIGELKSIARKGQQSVGPADETPGDEPALDDWDEWNAKGGEILAELKSVTTTL